MTHSVFVITNFFFLSRSWECSSSRFVDPELSFPRQWCHVGLQLRPGRRATLFGQVVQRRSWILQVNILTGQLNLRTLWQYRIYYCNLTKSHLTQPYLTNLSCQIIFLEFPSFVRNDQFSILTIVNAFSCLFCSNFIWKKSLT